MRLHPLTLDRLKTHGLHRDPETKGLYFQITKAGVKSWVFRFMLAGKAHTMGLGPYPLIKLSEAGRRLTTPGNFCSTATTRSRLAAKS
jgi:hypothetical protein